MAEQILKSKSELHWQCRRGMRELDLMFTHFLHENYADFSNTENVLFQRLLAYPDQLLFDWMMGVLRPSDPQIGGIVERVRAALRAPSTALA